MAQMKFFLRSGSQGSAGASCSSEIWGNLAQVSQVRSLRKSKPSLSGLQISEDLVPVVTSSSGSHAASSLTPLQPGAMPPFTHTHTHTHTHTLSTHTMHFVGLLNSLRFGGHKDGVTAEDPSSHWLHTKTPFLLCLPLPSIAFSFLTLSQQSGLANVFHS